MTASDPRVMQLVAQCNALSLTLQQIMAALIESGIFKPGDIRILKERSLRVTAAMKDSSKSNLQVGAEKIEKEIDDIFAALEDGLKSQGMLD